MIINLFIFLFVFFFSFPFAKSYAEFRHGIAMHGDLKYKADFSHFDYVNPKAPKGGDMKFSVVGTFDSLNPFLIKGTPPPGLSMFSERIVYEQLMARALDEPFSLYGWIAEKADMAEDRSAITFQLNPQACWKDGQPIRAADVAFTFHLLKEKGTYNFQLFAKRVDRVDILSERMIRFTFKKIPEGGYDREAPLLIALMAVLPEHLLKGRDFEKIVLEAIPGSGPYEIESFKPGHQIRYKRRLNWWGADLPVNRGRFNVDKISFDYYRNQQIEFEALKSGLTDFYSEKNPLLWEKNYQFPAVQRGEIKKLEYENKGVQVGMKGFVFNTRSPLFTDRRIRQALTLAFNFQALNKTLYQGQFKRINSYFENTVLASEGLPEGKELDLLKPYQQELPSELFQSPFTLAQETDSAQRRMTIKKAFDLLAQAGWVIQKGVLVNQETHKPFTFEILLYQPESEKLALAYAKDLKALGIKVNLRLVDAAQYENRTNNYDYDMIIGFWGHTLSPGNEQKLYWHSRGVTEPYTRNYAGVQSSAVDDLCDQVAQAKDRDSLITAIRALDRVLLWGYYVVPLFYQPKIYLAHHAKFSHPKIDPKVGIIFATWWCKEEKTSEQ